VSDISVLNICVLRYHGNRIAR